MASKYDALKLENDISFPLYAASKEIVHKYKPYLDELNLTYTQYLAMLALWEHEELTVGEIGNLLYLDSGTLTPLLKKLETKGYIARKRSVDDERKVFIVLTDAGLDLRKKAAKVPSAVEADLDFDPEDAKLLFMAVNWLLDQLDGAE